MQFFSLSDLEGMKEEIRELEMALVHFYTVFCPSVGLTQEDVEEMKTYYKTFSIGDYFKLKGKEQFTEIDLLKIARILPNSKRSESGRSSIKHKIKLYKKN